MLGRTVDTLGTDGLGENVHIKVCATPNAGRYPSSTEWRFPSESAYPV